MKRLSMIALSVVLALIVSCGGDGSDPLSSGNAAAEFGGTLTMGSNGVNTPSSESNKESVSQAVLDQVYGAYARLFRDIVTGNALPYEPYRATGNFFGNAESEGFDKLVPLGTGGGYDYSFEMTLNDFSNSGSVFIGGKLKVDGTMRLVGENWMSGDLIVDKGIAFAGNYNGKAVFDNLLVPLDSLGRLISVTATSEQLYGHSHNGSLSLVSGDVTVRFNPYYRQQVPQD